MRLVEMHLDGFGQLVNRAFQFAPGFNLVFGPNEAGKSTLQRAILSLLYGFFSEGRIKAAERDAAAIFRPWDEGASYAGSLIYQLADGQTLQVSRTFAPSATSLATYPDGVDVSSQFRKESQGRLLFAEAQLGMNKEVFENTCHVRQAELVALDVSATAITETLMRLSASASTDITAAEALAMLEKTFREEVGTERSPTKPLPRAKKHLSELEEERSRVLQARRELFSQIVELNQSTERLQRLDLERGRLRYLQKLAEGQAIRQQISAAEKAAVEVNRCAEEVSRWQAWAAFPVQLRDHVLQLATQRSQVQKECRAAQGQAAQAREQLRSIETQLAAVQERIAGLASVRDVPVEALPRVRQLAGQCRLADEAGRSASERWRKAHSLLEEAEQRLAQERAQLEPAVKLGHGGLAALRQQLLTARQRVALARESLGRAQAERTRVGMDEIQFQQLERTAQEIQSGVRPAPQPRKGCRALLSRQSVQSADRTPTELLVYAQVKPIFEAWVQARAEEEAACTALGDVETGVINQLGGLIDSSLGDNTFVQLDQRLERYLRTEAEVEQRQAVVAGLKLELDATGQRYEEACTALQTVLVRVGFEATNVQAALDAYLKQCERKAQLEREEAEMERLRLQAQALGRDANDWQKKQAALAGVEGELCNLLAQADIECSPDSLGNALARFNEGIQNYNHWAQAKAAHVAAIKHHSSIVEAQHRAGLKASLAEIESLLAGMLAEHPEWSELKPDKASREYATLSEQVAEAQASAREKYNRLKDSIQQVASNLRHPAEVDEEISQVRVEIERLEWFGATLELASQELAQATQEFQKQFAPKLELLMSEGLSRVTRERYSDVQVDPQSLDVSLTAPELGRSIGVGHLSIGTRDLVYLMLRVAIARLMSHTQERLPLLLDDPLVQCDRARQEQAIEFLAHLAEETQVFLFTKDEWTKEWFEEKLRLSPAHSVHILD
jgi:DNA repair exonuclease SbcCD ATPase subunit